MDSVGMWVQVFTVQVWTQVATVHSLTGPERPHVHVASESLDVLNHRLQHRTRCRFPNRPLLRDEHGIISRMPKNLSMLSSERKRVKGMDIICGPGGGTITGTLFMALAPLAMGAPGARQPHGRLYFPSPAGGLGKGRC